jgi:hypothetical protein
MATAAFYLTGRTVFLFLGFVSCFGFLFRYYIKLETMFSAVNRDSAFLDRSRAYRQVLYTDLAAQRSEPKSIGGRLSWFWFRNRAFFALDEAEHITLGALAAFAGRPDLWLWVFACSQPAIALVRLVQRGYQLARRPESLTYPLRK